MKSRSNIRFSESTYHSSKPTIPLFSVLQSTRKELTLPRILSFSFSTFSGPYIMRVSHPHDVQGIECAPSNCIRYETVSCVSSFGRCQNTCSFEIILLQHLHCTNSPRPASDAHISCITSCIPIKSRCVRSLRCTASIVIFSIYGFC